MVISAPITSPTPPDLQRPETFWKPPYITQHKAITFFTPPTHPCWQQSEFEMQVGGRRAATEMRNQRLSRGLPVTAQRSTADAGWQVQVKAARKGLLFYGGGEAVRMEEHCPEPHWCRLIDRSCLKLQGIRVTPWDKLAVSLVNSARSDYQREKKIIMCFMTGLSKSVIPIFHPRRRWSNSIQQFIHAILYILILYLVDTAEQKKTHLYGSWSLRADWS